MRIILFGALAATFAVVATEKPIGAFVTEPPSHELAMEPLPGAFATKPPPVEFAIEPPTGGGALALEPPAGARAGALATEPPALVPSPAADPAKSTIHPLLPKPNLTKTKGNYKRQNKT